MVGVIPCQDHQHKEQAVLGIEFGLALVLALGVLSWVEECGKNVCQKIVKFLLVKASAIVEMVQQAAQVSIYIPAC